MINPLDYIISKNDLYSVKLSLEIRKKEIEKKAPDKTELIEDLDKLIQMVDNGLKMNVLLDRELSKQQVTTFNQYKLIVELKMENEELTRRNKHLKEGIY